MSKDTSDPSKGQLHELEKRLRRYVVRPDDQNGCWLWEGPLSNAGYGAFKWKGTTKSVHRVIQEIWNGPIPPGHIVKHSCDVRHCVNPAHLSTGTQKENLAEMEARGRANRATGKRHGRHTKPERTAKGEGKRTNKLTERDVLALRLRAAEGASYRALGEVFGVHHTIVGRIARGEDWAHVGGPRTHKGQGRRKAKS